MAMPEELATTGTMRDTGVELNMLMQQLKNNLLKDKHTFTGAGRYVRVWGWGGDGRGKCVGSECHFVA